MDELRLIEAAKSGNSDAMTDLVERYKNLLRRVVAPYYIVGADREDLLQEATLGFIKAINEYDAAREVSFSSFASSLAKQRVIDAIRQAQRKKHSPLNEAKPIVATIDDEDGEMYNVDATCVTGDPMDDYIAAESQEIMRAAIEQSLTLREKQILKLSLEGHTYQETADVLHISAKTVDNTLVNVRKKLKLKKDLL